MSSTLGSAGPARILFNTTRSTHNRPGIDLPNRLRVSLVATKITMSLATTGYDGSIKPGIRKR
ncbi:hypothetical protein PSHT_06781 [Puccinia striiformis]|uniref:Uncharacterized protein n=3 Tax=Puccinia striiformis TaxID=27350 RepID=A0A0L0VI49_9BASI|nr:hypothetical protein PSTG_07783 [Puccinia striiformis f. sp. tritici PST-78]POW12288.1 hypothetical protein PSTT_04637 [Puccinia striiformis]POW16400.1 hypothetical protein PSHT_06781 [Puccinia striiformis]